MAHSSPGIHWRSVTPYLFVGFPAFLAWTCWLVGAPWYLTVGIVCIAFIIMLSQRRIFGLGISRTATEIRCRYIPWHEGNAYLVSVLVPLMGVVMVAAGRSPDFPAWLQFCGFSVLALTPLLEYISLRSWRRSFLRISPSALTLSVTMLGSKPIEIPRRNIESIEPKMVPNEVSGKSSQVEVAYRTDSDGTHVETVVFGLWLTVRPTDLANALTTWLDAGDGDPTELLDRVEQILRGHTVA